MDGDERRRSSRRNKRKTSTPRDTAAKKRHTEQTKVQKKCVKVGVRKGISKSGESSAKSKPFTEQDELQLQDLSRRASNVTSSTRSKGLSAQDKLHLQDLVQRANRTLHLTQERNGDSELDSSDHSDESGSDLHSDDDGEIDIRSASVKLSTDPIGTEESDGEQDVSFSNVAEKTPAPKQPQLDPIVNHVRNEAGNVQFPVLNGDSQPNSLANHTVGNPRSSSITEIQGDDSVVINMINIAKESIMKCVNSSVERIFVELKRQNDAVQKLHEHVTNLSTIVSVTASSVFVKQPSANPRTKDIHSQICLLPALFTDVFMSHILAKCLIGYGLKISKDSTNSNDYEKNGLELLNVMFFSKQPNEKTKDIFLTSLGKKFSQFRFGMLMTSFLVMQKNYFNTFLSDNESDISGLMSGLTDNSQGGNGTIAPESVSITGWSPKMKQPFWLRPGYVSAEHCQLAIKKSEKRLVSESSEGSQVNGESESCERHEQTQTTIHSTVKSKSARSGPITRDEISLEAASLVCRSITNVLHKARDAAKIQIFHEVLYLFTGWSQLEHCPVDQRNMTIRWEKEAPTSYECLDGIPLTKTMKLFRRFLNSGNEVDSVNGHNNKALNVLVENHPDLCLVVEHDVVVEDKQRIISRSNTHRLRYRIHLIEVASKLVAAYTSLESNSKSQYILGVDSNGLRSVLIIAIGLRALLHKPVLDAKATNSIPWFKTICAKSHKRRGRPSKSDTSAMSGGGHTYKFIEIDGFCLRDIMAPPSRQKECLGMLLSLTPQEYENKNEGIGRDVNTHGPRSVICADEDNGVFGFV